MTWNDKDYFRKRAAVERTLAEAASDPRVAPVHQELAERYEALVREGNRPTLHIVTARAAEAA
jgi:transposase